MQKISPLIKNEYEPLATDFSGSDAMSRNPAQLKQEVTEFAIRVMPEVLRKCALIVQTSKSNKDIIEAAKFIKLVADGQLPKSKTVNGIVKRMNDADLSADLEGQIENED